MTWYLPDKHPVFWDDLRRRLRKRRTYGVLIGFVLVLFAVLIGFVTTNDPQAWPRLGRNLFLSTMSAQAVMVCLLTPALTATAFSSERDSKRLDLLFLTGLSTRDLVYCKYFGAVAVLLLVLVCGVPVLAIIAASFGGISPGELAFSYLTIIFYGLYCAAVGLIASCRKQNSLNSLIEAYVMAYISGVMLLYVIGVGFLFASAVFPPLRHASLMQEASLCIALGIVSIFMCLKEAVYVLEKERQLAREEMLPSLSTGV